MNIFDLIIYILGVITTIIPLIFTLKHLKCELMSAQNDVDKEKAIVEMLGVTQGLIQVVETAYENATGKEKKSTVMAELENYAVERNFDFERDYWSKVIDDLVDMTNVVNVHK